MMSCRTGPLLVERSLRDGCTGLGGTILLALPLVGEDDPDHREGLCGLFRLDN